MSGVVHVASGVLGEVTALATSRPRLLLAVSVVLALTRVRVLRAWLWASLLWVVGAPAPARHAVILAAARRDLSPPSRERSERKGSEGTRLPSGLRQRALRRRPRGKSPIDSHGGATVSSIVGSVEARRN